MKLIDLPHPFDRVSDDPVSDKLRRTVLKGLPPRAAARVKHFGMLADADDAAHEGRYRATQANVARRLDLESRVRRAHSDAEHVEAEEELAEFKAEELARKKLPQTDSGIHREHLNQLTRYSAQLIQTGTPIRDAPVELPKKSSDVLLSMLSETREQITAKEKGIDGILTAVAPKTEVMSRLSRDLDDFAAAGAPDLWEALREEMLTDGRTRIGKVRWARAFISGETFTPDGFHLLFWLFKDQIRERMGQEVDRLIGDRKPIAAIERPKRIEKIKNEILRLERTEEALVEHLRAAGRTDISYRANIMHPLARLGIQTGKRT